MTRLRPDELAARLQEANPPFVLDIRPSAVVGAEAIEGSYSLPVYTDIQHGNEDALRRQLEAIPTDTEIIVVCKMGIVAKRATRILREEGYDAKTLMGGMSGWLGYQNQTVGYKIRRLLWGLR